MALVGLPPFPFFLEVVDGGGQRGDHGLEVLHLAIGSRSGGQRVGGLVDVGRDDVVGDVGVTEVALDGGPHLVEVGEPDVGVGVAGKAPFEALDVRLVVFRDGHQQVDGHHGVLEVEVGTFQLAVEVHGLLDVLGHVGERAGLGPQADAVGQRETLVDALEDRGLGVGGPSRDDEVVGAVAVGGVAVLALDGHAGGRVPDGRKDQEVQGAVELIDVLVLDDPGETVAVAVLVSDAVVCLQLALG